MLDLKDLQCFIVVYNTRGFGRGANALHTVQSNVSVKIKRLEDAVGGPLFERKHRGIVPTARGEILYRHATRVLSELGELESVLKSNIAA